MLTVDQHDNKQEEKWMKFDKVHMNKQAIYIRRLNDGNDAYIARESCIKARLDLFNRL